MRTVTTSFGLMLALVFLGINPAFAQKKTHTEVEAGQNTLLDAIAAAAPGDTLVLTTDGGQYQNDDELKPDSSLTLTIMAAPGLKDRPVLTNNGPDGTKDIIRLYGDLTLIGLEFDGLAGMEGLNAKYAIRTGTGSGDAGTNVKKGYVLKIIDCYFHDIVSGSDGNAFRGYSQTMADSIIIRNTLVFNTGKEGIRVRDEDSDRPGFGFFNVKYFEVSNSTFWEIKNDAISVYGGDQDPNTPGPEVVIDKVTMHNVGHYLLNLKYVDNATVTNTIMVNNYDIVNETGKTLGAPWLETAATLSHSDTLNVSDDGAWTGETGAGDPNTPTIINLYAVDPMFVDAAKGDFTLMEGSPLIGEGQDGTTLGDSRWAPKTPEMPKPSIRKIPAGQNTLSDAVDTAVAGDVLELTDSGGEYLNDGRMDITVPLTIRAAAGLDERPVLKNNEPDESTRVVFEVLNSLHLDGVEIDGQAGTDFNAKYLLRVRGAVDSSTVLKVTDSYLHDVVAGSDGNFLRQYPETFADSIIFRNSILSGSGKEGIRTKDEATDSGLFNVKYFEVSNTTMANTRASAIYVYSGDTDPATPEPEFIVDRLTCHNCGHGNGRAIYARGIQTAKITNSIIANSLVSEEGWSVNLTGTSSISHSNLFMVSKIQLGGESTQAEISEINPEFANPDMLDFTIPANSPLRTLGTDGMGIGDMRWMAMTNVATEEDTPFPSETDIVLDQNYPNPFNIETTIPYHMGRDGYVTLEVFDLLGRRVARLKDGYDPAGSYSVSLSMQQQGAGTYFYRLTVDGESTWRKLVVVN